MTRPWHDLALCREVDDRDVFFPPRGGSAGPAKAICGRCPVTAECLTEALEMGERYGVRGGMSERERRRLHDRRAA